MQRFTKTQDITRRAHCKRSSQEDQTKAIKLTPQMPKAASKRKRIQNDTGSSFSMRMATLGAA